MTASTEHHVEEDNLYDRVERVLGAEAMKRMKQAKVLIVGLGGLGVEIAKNVILTGVGQVTLADEKKTTFFDLSSQFYLSEDSIGVNRAEASLQKLRELNPFVKINLHTQAVTEDIITQHNVVIFTDHHISQLVPFNQICRKHNVKFIAAETRGLFGALFCDFGKDFIVYDDNGEEPVSNLVTSITQDKEGTVSVHDDRINHGLGDGDTVRFEAVEGMTELNSTAQNPKLFTVKVTGKHEFSIGDTSNFSKYKQGGYVYQVKQPKSHSYMSLEDSIKSPQIIDYDWGKMNHPPTLHKLFQALADFSKKNGRLPRPHNDEDANAFVDIAKNYDAEIDIKIATNFSKTAQGNLNPMVTVFGGFAGQEVLKACSGKFTPLNQWFYFDCLEALPDDPIEESDAQPVDSRYDGQIVVFGKVFQQKLLDLNVFMVGVGALGCEYLKNFAMLGVGGGNGKITITDLDSIEISNLSRQFLFRRRHIGKMKSSSGAEAVKDMNPNVNVVPLQEKVCPETEKVFNDTFWEELDVVTNALDNINARMYVDQRCVYYHKPLLEAGTLGPKGNTQVVVPHLTESYSSSQDPPEQEIPICTLKNFPNAIEHTIQWAREKFEELFNKIPAETNNYLSNPDFLSELEQNPATKLSVLTGVYESLVSHKPTHFEECITWARLRFEQYFHNIIAQLLHNFPVDMVTSKGTPFWGGPKKPPIPITFNSEDPLHLEFVIRAANLRAATYGIQGHDPKDVDLYKKVIASVDVPKFSPKEGVKIAVTDAEAKEEDDNAIGNPEETQYEDIVRKLPSPSSLVGFKMAPVEFEKDDDTNHHIDFITATSNLRAANYKIPPADRKKTKGIAGKIMPAMVTTTALTTGLGTLEFYKLVQKKKNLTDYANTFLSVALPFLVQSDPVAPKSVPFRDQQLTLWDRFEVDEGRDITMREFFDLFEKKHKLSITMVSSGNAVIYTFFGNKKTIQERMAKPLSQVISGISGEPYYDGQKYVTIEICCNDTETEDDVDVPYVRYRIY